MISTYPKPWTVTTVFERFAHLKSARSVQWSTTLSEEEAKAVFIDAISHAERRTDLGVIDSSLLFYLSRGSTQQP